MGAKIDYVRSPTLSPAMEHDWVPPQPPSSQLPPGSLEPAPGLFLHEPAVPHREKFGSHNTNHHGQTTYPQFMLASNISTSESTRSLLQESQSSNSNGHSASVSLFIFSGFYDTINTMTDLVFV